jgi:hypothetical protein
LLPPGAEAHFHYSSSYYDQGYWDAMTPRGGNDWQRAPYARTARPFLADDAHKKAWPARLVPIDIASTSIR